MISTRLTISAGVLTLLLAAHASAEPAYVRSTVNLRTGAGTTNESIAKIPGGSLVDVASCTEGWCDVDWKGKKGFAIETALDRSGRVPTARPAAAPRGAVAGVPADAVPVGAVPVGAVPVGPAPVVVGPPVVVGGPIYPYRYYYGYGPRRYYGYRRYRRW